MIHKVNTKHIFELKIINVGEKVVCCRTLQSVVWGGASGVGSLLFKQKKKWIYLHSQFPTCLQKRAVV